MKSLAFVLALLLPMVAVAAEYPTSAPQAVVEESAVVEGPPTEYGTTTHAYLTLTAWDARPIDSSVTYAFVNSPGGQGIARTGGAVWLKVPVQLPSGVVVTELEVNYCDTGAGAIAVHWFRQVKNGNPVVISNVVSSTGTPGCVVHTGTFATPQVIANDGNSYNLELYMGATDASIIFLSARVVYHLQVSPAPPTATFPGDVPTTHPFFRFIEALAASGITGGCGPDLYCPDQPLTRGQMAVFLATAHGMHYPD
jgi:hypothetical protein